MIMGIDPPQWGTDLGGVSFHRERPPLGESTRQSMMIAAAIQQIVQTTRRVGGADRKLAHEVGALIGPLVLAAALVLAANLAVNASAVAQEASDDPAPPEAGISVDDDVTTDIAIERRIRAILREIEGFADVSVEVNSGVVRLTGEVLEAADIDELEALVGRVEGVVTIENGVVETTDVAERLTPAFDRFENRITQLISYFPLLLVALAVFLAIVAAGVVLARWRGPFERIAPNAFIADIYRQVVRIAFFVAGIVVALDILGATALIGTILGAAGIVGLAIGFAVRDTVENFVASVMLSIRQPFRPNDFVEIDGEQGNVARLTSRATILMSLDGNHVRIPNATVFKSRIINFTRNPERRFEFDLGVDAEADLLPAQEIALAALGGLDFVLTDPPPKIWIEAVGDSNVIIRVSGWIDQQTTDFAAARGEAIRVTKDALEGAGFGLPEPIYRLRFDRGELPLAGAPDREEARPAPRKPRPAATPADVSAEKDQTIEDKVEEERANEGVEDLLSSTAPEE